MIQKFDIKNFPKIESLHDSATSSIELQDNKLIFYFEHVFAENEAEEETKPHRKLKVTYCLHEKFQDEHPFACVKNINEKKLFIKNAIKYFTLNELVFELKTKQRNLMVYAQYFNNCNCIIIADMVENKKGWQMYNKFNIELLVDEIIYDWIE